MQKLFLIGRHSFSGTRPSYSRCRWGLKNNTLKKNRQFLVSRMDGQVVFHARCTQTSSYSKTTTTHLVLAAKCWCEMTPLGHFILLLHVASPVDSFVPFANKNKVNSSLNDSHRAACTWPLEREIGVVCRSNALATMDLLLIIIFFFFFSSSAIVKSLTVAQKQQTLIIRKKSHTFLPLSWR